MAKYTTEDFIEKCKLKHGDKYDYSESKYEGLEKDFTFKCPIHGEVKQKAKSHLVRSGCYLCDQEKAKSRRRKSSYSKSKGNAYEVQIAKELAYCGYPEVVTSRSESKRMDDNKIDLIDREGRLPINVQLKKTQNIPSYFKIAESCPLKDKPFCLIWNAQKLKEGQVNISSLGEVAIIPKQFFYDLLKAYTIQNNI